MVKIHCLDEIAVKTKNSSYKLLRKGFSYILDDALFQKYEDLFATSAVVTDFDKKEGTEKVLFLFNGGIGDIVSFEPCLKQFALENNSKEIAIASYKTEECILGDFTVFEYPILADFAEYYDSIYEVKSPSDYSVDLQDHFAMQIGVAPPRRCMWLVPNEHLSNMFSVFFRDRKKVGICLKSAAHFRSIPTFYGISIAAELVSMGYDCFLIGSPEQRYLFKKDGQYCAAPDGMKDMCGVIEDTEQLISFLDCMDYVLTTDTSTLHIAGALGKKTLGLFGMTDGGVRCSYYPTVDYLQSEFTCSPCNLVKEEVPCIVNKTYTEIYSDFPKYCNALCSFEIKDVIKRLIRNGNT